MINTDKKIFEILKKWRLDKAKKKGWSPRYIFHDNHLKNIVKAKPKSLNELSEISRIGNVKLKEYKKEIIKMFK